jgi:serine/threonine-protein kinase
MLVGQRYRVLRRLGQGGMGVVYLARHELIERPVALKILSNEFASDADQVQRFLHEARAAARIGHENIVEVFDFGEIDDSVYIAMEYLEGQDLAQALRQEVPFPRERIGPILAQVFSALGAAHGKGLIHRDLKPDNIFLIDREGRADFVKVLDFGLVKFAGEEPPAGERLTRVGTVVGTPEYMSPEQVRGDVLDHRCDIYAMGCILYEMLTGAPPFTSEKVMEVMARQLCRKAPPPSSCSERPICAELDNVCMRALEKDPAHRFASMAEMAAALEEALRIDAEMGPMLSQKTVIQARPEAPPPASAATVLSAEAAAHMATATATAARDPSLVMRDPSLVMRDPSMAMRALVPMQAPVAVNVPGGSAALPLSLSTTAPTAKEHAAEDIEAAARKHKRRELAMILGGCTLGVAAVILVISLLMGGKGPTVQVVPPPVTQPITQPQPQPITQPQPPPQPLAQQEDPAQAQEPDAPPSRRDKRKRTRRGRSVAAKQPAQSTPNKPSTDLRNPFGTLPH